MKDSVGITKNESWVGTDMRRIVQLLSFYGRFNRSEYITVLFGGFVFVIFSLGIGFALAQVFGDAVFVPVVLLAIAAKWAAVAGVAKRFHDLGYTGWCALTLVVPFLSLLVLVLLIFIPGESEPNEHGEPTDFFEAA